MDLIHRDRTKGWIVPGMRKVRRLVILATILAVSLAQPGQRRNALFAAPPENNVAAEDEPADADAATKPKSEKPAVPLANPLQNLIQRIFNPGGPVLRNRRPPQARMARPNARPGEEQPHRVNPSDRDHIDSRAPHDAKIEHQLRLAQTAIGKQDWKQALLLLQQLLDLPEDSLHRLPDGRWQSVRVMASRELGRAPKAVLESYQQQNGGLAKQLLAEALREGDVAGVIRVATRFFHTEAGHQAADSLTLIHQDRAEFGIAAQWLDELLTSQASFLRLPAWRLRAAALYRQAGRNDDADRVLQGVSLDEQAVQIDGTKIPVPEWLAALPSNSNEAPRSLDDWPQLSGTAARAGLQTGGAPFLMAQWQVPYSSSHSVRQRIEWMVQELADQNHPALMAPLPLAIAGKGIYRDLRGVRVIDLETGASVWESIEGMSAERISTGMAGENGSEQASIVIMNEMHDPFGGNSADSHPLMSLMLRDAAYNTLSSDGRQVFLIEDQGILSRHHPGYHWGWDGEQPDPYGFSWSTNRLSSYDLETGRPLWTVGGPETNESFQLPLAGVYFHGVPTPDGDDLFAIGSKGDEVRLWCLDRRTGGHRWSQLIGYADTKIEQDTVRRWMAALPSVSEGVVVCPTTIGWLVAVDRLRQSVLWAVRYSPPTQGMDYSMNNNMTPYRALGGQWGVSAPTVIGQQVLYTPPEDDRLICVDLVSGAQRWQVPRDDGQYLAGATNDRAIVVGLNQVTAFSLAEGKKLWSHPLGEDAQPSGRAALTAEQVFIPLTTGELRAISLDKGETALRTFVPSGQPALGNLLLHRGRMVSLNFQGLTEYRQQSALLAEIQQRKAQNPTDPVALLNEAEIHLLNREPDAALALLKQVPAEGLSDELRVRLARNRITGLTAVIRQNLAASEQPLAELAAAAIAPEDRLLHLDLSAERFLTLGQHEQAFELYAKLTTEPADGFVTRTDDAKVLVQRPAWLSGRLRDVWSASQGAVRERIDARIVELLAASTELDAAARDRLGKRLGFHPSLRALTRQSIDTQLQAGKLAVAEIELLRLLESGEPGDAAWAAWKLGDLMERLKSPADAAWHYRRLAAEFGTATLPDGRTGTQVLDAIRQAATVPLDPVPQHVAWDERLLKVTQLPFVYNQPPQEILTESRLPFFETVDIEYLPREQRLSIQSRREGGPRWLAPLRNGTSQRYSGYVSAEPVGHSLAIVHQDVLHLLHPLTRETLWAVPLDGLAEGGLPPAHGGRSPFYPMWSVQQGHGMQSPWFQQLNRNDRLAVVQSGYIAVQGRRAIHVLDSRSGAELWRRTSVPPQSVVLGGPDLLWIVPPNLQNAQGYRVSDGTPVPVEQIDKLLGKAIGLVGNDLLLAESGPGMKILALDRTKTILRRYNPLSQADLWKEEFKTGAMIARVSDDELFVLPSSGEAELVQAATGQRQALEALKPKDLQSRSDCYALADEDRIFALINAQPGGGNHHFAESLQSIRAHGTICAWQRSTGKLLWKQAIQNQHLIVDHLRAAPVLVFCSREWKQRGNINFSELSLLVLHKQTGKRLHESITPTIHNGFHSLAVLPDEQALELRSYNMRIKLSPADQPAQPPASKGSD